MNTVKLLILLFTFLVSRNAQSQDTTSISQISSKYFDAVSKKANSLNDKLDKKSQKALTKFQRLEIRLKSKLTRLDSLTANNVFADADEKYRQLEEKLRGNKPFSEYIPSLDTTITSLKFIEQNSQLLKDGKEKLNDALSKIRELQDRLQKAEDIKQFLKERRQYLKEQLGRLGFAKQLKKINKDVYYFAATIQNYREILKDSKKTERKAIELLSKTKVFQDFIKKNGMLASLFGVAGNPNDPNYIPSLTGLQTRAQVNSIIQNQLAAGGPNTQQVFQQNIQQGQAQLQQLKDKINKLGTNSRDDFIPEDFRPNPVKGLSFFQRIHIGADFQTTKHNRFFPISSDIGLSLRYVLNSNSNISIGSSFKVGWGSGFDNISLSSQGISIRGGFDWRLRGNLFIAGNYEQNYFSEIRNIDQIRDHKSWKTSALLGLSKKYKAEKKRTGEIKLLYDFFYNRPPVRTQSIIFRFGYNF